jgi:hypothetical protein
MSKTAKSSSSAWNRVVLVDKFNIDTCMGVATLDNMEYTGKRRVRGKSTGN